MDLPPPRLTAEANTLSRMADGILIVIRHGKTPRKAVKNLIEIIDPKKIAGVVSNGFEIGIGSKYGYGKYGYYK